MMKSILTVCLLFTLSCFVNAVVTQPIDKTRLYKIIRESTNNRFDFASTEDPILASPRLSVKEQANSLENEDTVRMKVRNSWDSEEDYYFSWASQNRRPMEPIPGRRRSMRIASTSLPRGRIGGGLWRSGMVG